MDDKTREQVKRWSRDHKILLGGHTLGKVFKWYGRFGLLPIDFGWLIGIIYWVVAHSFWLLIPFGLTGKFLLSLAIYAAVHGLILLTGFIISKLTEKELNKLEETVRSGWVDVEVDMLNRYNIRYGDHGFEVHYGDTVIKYNGTMCLPLRQDYGSIYLFQNDHCDEEVERQGEMLYASGDRYMDMEKNIASVDFNRKFTVVTEKENQLQCMKLLSPTVQLALLQNQGLQSLHNIHFDGYLLTANTKEEAEVPECTTVFQWHSVIKQFRALEQYCLGIRNKTDSIYYGLKAMNQMIEI